MKNKDMKQMIEMLESHLHGTISRFTPFGTNFDDPEREAKEVKNLVNTLSRLLKDFEKLCKLKVEYAHLFEPLEEKIEITTSNNQKEEEISEELEQSLEQEEDKKISKISDPEPVQEIRINEEKAKADIEFFEKVKANDPESVYKCKCLIRNFQKSRGNELELEDITFEDCVTIAKTTIEYFNEFLSKTQLENSA